MLQERLEVLLLLSVKQKNVDNIYIKKYYMSLKQYILKENVDTVISL